MSADDLQRVRLKVEKGEVLAEDELRLLRHAARGESGSTLKLAVAHALVNAGEERQALGALTRLARDYPHDVQVHLGLARALLGLERFSPAERALKDALRLNPQDPEALKGLATVALRRGEVAQAHAHLAEVLKIDPLDEEAQLLVAELEAGDLPPPPPASSIELTEFIRAVSAQLARASMAHRVEGEALVVRLPSGEVARLEARSLYAGYLEGGGELSTSVEAIVRELREGAVGVPEEKEAVLQRVLPVVRDGAFLARAAGACHREGPAGLWIFYVLEDPSLVRYLPRGALGSRGLSLEEVDAAAFANLDARPATAHAVSIERGQLSLSRTATGLWALAEADGHDAARLLTLAQRRALAVCGEPPLRVGLGFREWVLLCREQDLAAVGVLEALPSAPDGIRGKFLLDVDGTLRAL
ncbi:MAG: tetratricopeptide repeat protein [Myxococcota bacterium]